jgi:hypothetical protein
MGLELAAFGPLWITQFVILDRVLFADRRRRVATIATGSASVRDI